MILIMEDVRIVNMNIKNVKSTKGMNVYLHLLCFKAYKSTIIVYFTISILPLEVSKTRSTLLV